jgi:exonuclease SbcD
MRILHTADWHLGKKLEDHGRLAEQRAVLAEICELADSHQVDAVVIAGDLFDTFNPATEAVELFYQTVKRLACEGQRPVIAIAGNHDSPDRIEAPDPLSRENGILFAGYPHSQLRPFQLGTGLRVRKSDQGFVELNLPQVTEPLRLLLAPYANEQRLKQFLGVSDPDQQLQEVLTQQWQGLADQYLDDQGVNILLGHLFMISPGTAIPEEPDGEKPINHPGGATAIETASIPDAVQYTALGHLHGYRRLKGASGPVVYSSSPLAYSFHEAGQPKYVNLITAEPGKPVQQEALSLQAGKPLHRKRFNAMDEAIQWLEANRECLVELTLVTDTYIGSEQRRQLHRAHSGIVHLIPEIQGEAASSEDTRHQLDVQQDLTSLFQAYFQHQQGQPPGGEIMSLFREVLDRDHNQQSENDNEAQS